MNNTLLNLPFCKTHYKDNPHLTCLQLNDVGVIKKKICVSDFFETEKNLVGKNFLDFIVKKDDRIKIGDFIKNKKEQTLQIRLKNTRELGDSFYTVFFEVKNNQVIACILPIILNHVYDDERIKRSKFYHDLFVITEKMHSNKNGNLHATINLILKKIADFLRFETVIMFLLNKDKKYENTYAYGGKKVEESLGQIILDIKNMDDDGVFYRTIKDKKSYFIQNILDPDNDIILDEEIMPILECRSLLSIPLINHNEKCIGAIIVDREKQSFQASNTQKKLLHFFCNQISIALSNFEFSQIQQQHAKDLKKKVDQKTAKLQRAYEKLQEIDRMKTEFVSIASHQLRTPLTAIRWFLDMVLDDEKLHDDHKDTIEQALNSNIRMITLVNDLLSVSRLESGILKLDPEGFSLQKVVQMIKMEITPLVKEKKQKVTLQIEKKLPDVFADKSLISQVVQNLISNAIKYTPEKGKVEISLKKINKKNKDFVKFCVSDTGLGIPKEDQKKLFGKFFRSKNVTKTEIDGSGLGLYIAKSIVEKSLGEMKFSSVENKGSTFWFTLPSS